MKEVICNELLREKTGKKTERETTRKELKKILPPFYTIDGGGFGIFYISKFVPRGGRGKSAKIFYLNRSIKIGDKRLYPILKQFGEKHEYLALTKCWKGCEQEAIEG